MNEKVQFLGLRNDTASLYNVMDIFVLPSWYEGLPVVGVEAQANGLSCIVSDKVSDECSLTSSLSFLSLEKSAEEWANLILHSANGRNSHAERELTDAGFEIKIEAHKLQNFYESLMANV